MHITQVFIKQITRPNRQLVAVGNVTIDNMLSIREVQVIRRFDGSCFVMLPSVKTFGMPKNPRTKVYTDSRGLNYFYRDVVGCSDLGLRREIETVVGGAYRHMVALGKAEALYEVPAPSAVKVG